MQQFFRTVATLFMGAVMAAGGYVAALVVPQLQTAGGDRLSSPSELFAAADPANQATPSVDSSLSLPKAADDWFGSFATEAEAAVTAAVPDPAEVVADETGAESAPSPFAKFAAAITPETAATPTGHPVTEAFGAVQIPQSVQAPRSIDDAFASAVSTTLDPPIGLARTASETTLTGPSSSTVSSSTVPRSASASESNEWASALDRLKSVDATNYRLTPTADGQTRCDVWVVEVTGQSVRRMYSGIGATPAASVSAAIDRILSRNRS